MTIEGIDFQKKQRGVIVQVVDTIRIMGAIVKESLIHPRGTSTIIMYDNPTRDIVLTRTSNPTKS